jgi:hypothetical protein
MSEFLDRVKYRVHKSIEKERNLERPIEAFSRVLWPYAESKLVLYVGLLAILDYLSTFAVLELSNNSRVSEAGLLAKWALQSGGFFGLLIMDLICVGIIIGLAIGVRAFYKRLGFNGFGRAAFIFLLVPYFVLIMAVVVNNTILTFQ